MNQNEHNQFGQYLRNLRESREMSVKAVEDKLHSLYPEKADPKNKSYHVSASHLSKYERGEVSPPYPLKLKALCEVYNENYHVMLYKAGYLDHNPSKELKKL